jgi:hypothetical protein
MVGFRPEALLQASFPAIATQKSSQLRVRGLYK